MSRYVRIPAQLLTLDGDWWRDAACCGEDPELFFPPEDADERIEAAKRVCDTCPIRQQCLDWAVSNREHGIWGGLTDRERQTERRRRAARRSPRACERCGEDFLPSLSHQRRCAACLRGCKPCGTYAAYKRHRRHGETPCQRCRYAMAEYRREQDRQKREVANAAA